MSRDHERIERIVRAWSPETGPASTAKTATYRAMAPASEPDPLPSENVE